jgi:hypothetical protein
MSQTLTISAASGRIFPKKPEANEEGLELIIDFSTNSSSTTCTSVSSTIPGQLFTSDSKGNITQFLLLQNRYFQHIRNITQCSFILQATEDQLFIVKNKDVLVYNINGKKVNESKQHCSSIQGLDFNQAKQLVLTFSAECVVIWNVKT